MKALSIVALQDVMDGVAQLLLHACGLRIASLCHLQPQQTGLAVKLHHVAALAALDDEAILESVEVTGRLVVVDEGNPRCGLASDIAGIVAEKGFHSLKAPIRTVTAPHTPVPFAPELEDAYIPSVEKILAAVRSIIGG